MDIITKEVVCLGKKILACDGKCNKSWGYNNRPKEILDIDNEEDYVFLADEELGDAPIDPGTYEGGFGKPQFESDKLNKWCYRECERCEVFDLDQIIELPDFSKRQYNLLEKNINNIITPL